MHLKTLKERKDGSKLSSIEIYYLMVKCRKSRI